MPEDAYSVVIPGKSLNELNKILEDTQDLVEIVMTEQQVLFKTENVLFYLTFIRRKLSRYITFNSRTKIKQQLQ